MRRRLLAGNWKMHKTNAELGTFFETFGTEVGTGLLFDDLDAVSSVDTIRFFTSNLNEPNFEGRTFDDVRVSTVGEGNNPPVANAGPDQSVAAETTVTLAGSHTDGDSSGPFVYAWLLTTVPSGSAASLSDPSAVNPTFVADLPGLYVASLTVTDEQGNTSAADSVNIVAAGDADILFSDTFDRQDSSVVGSPVVGEEWVEVQQTGASVSIGDNKLFWDDTSNVLLRPLVSGSFSPVSTGIIQWDLDFDWARIGADPGYELWMQIGDSNLMVNPISSVTRFTGVGVDLRWGSFNEIDQNLVARQDAGMGGPLGLGAISGPTRLSVTADLATRTYSVSIDGTEVGSGLHFDNLDTVSTLDTVRFFTSNLNEPNFEGRSFDNLVISKK